jgi:outer membrane protein assembly factor BamA
MRLQGRIFGLTICLAAIAMGVMGQTDTVDMSSLISKVLKRKGNAKPPSSLAILPSLGYNPSMGFIMGANATASAHLGDPADTKLSNAAATAFYTSKGILNFQVRHNVFTPGSRWFLQGNLQASQMAVIDYGLGTLATRGRDGFGVMGYPVKAGYEQYPIRFNIFRFNEKVYRRVHRNLYVGAGLNLDIHRRIRDLRLLEDTLTNTPHKSYSLEKGLDPERYSANGLMLGIQLNNREHPNRSYGGTYLDLVLRADRRFLGSSLNCTQLISEFRQYWSLSRNNPEHVLALWHLGTFRLSGDAPYLDLPGTAGDLFNRSGRGYTIGRFKGPSFFYLETEYRFPITRNKLLSGVLFLNAQTASDGKKVGLFERVEPAGGGGFRVLMKKRGRTNICIDYAVGRYGSNGFFFGLNEVF